MEKDLIDIDSGASGKQQLCLKLKFFCLLCNKEEVKAGFIHTASLHRKKGRRRRQKGELRQEEFAL